MTNARRAPLVLLTTLGVVFVAAFVVQRQRSGFLAAEARAPEARRLAEQHGLAPSEVLALHELHGGRLEPAQLATLTRDLARERDALGHLLLAVLAVRGKRDLANQIRVRAGGDPTRIRPLVAETREAVEDAVRFDSVAERYRDRGH